MLKTAPNTPKSRGRSSKLRYDILAVAYHELIFHFIDFIYIYIYTLNNSHTT